MEDGFEERRFVFFKESERLLRKGAKGSAKRRLEDEFRKAAEEDASLFGFQCLEGSGVGVPSHPSPKKRAGPSIAAGGEGLLGRTGENRLPNRSTG